MRKKKRITISQPYKNYPLQPYKNYPLQQLQKPTDIICRVVLTVQVQCSMSLFDRDFNILTLHCRAQNWTWIFRFGPTTWTTSTGSTQVNCFIWVELNWSNYNSSNHHGDAMADFAGVIFEPVSVRSPCITWSMHWSDPLHRYLEIFISHSAAAVPLLETDNISPVCQYIIEIWLFWCWKITFCLGQNIHISFGPNCWTEHQ